MDTQSPQGTFSKADLQLITNVLVHGLVGILLTLISEVFMKTNYGVYSPIVTMVLSLVSLSLTQFFNGPSAHEITISQLQQQIIDLQTSTKNEPAQPSINPTVPAPQTQQ